MLVVPRSALRVEGVALAAPRLDGGGRAVFERRQRRRVGLGLDSEDTLAAFDRHRVVRLLEPQVRGHVSRQRRRVQQLQQHVNGYNEMIIRIIG